MIKRKSISSSEISSAIEKIAADIAATHSGTKTLVLAAIANGGIAFSESLRARLLESHGLQTHSATIDISFHRDDIGVNPISKEVESTSLVQNPEDATIILTDDVMFTEQRQGGPLRIARTGTTTKSRARHSSGSGKPAPSDRAELSRHRRSTTIDEKVEVHLFPKNPEKSHVDILSP